MLKTAMPKTAEKNMSPPTLEATLAQKLRVLRDKKGLTQYQVVQGSGVSQRAYADFEGAKRLPSGRLLSKLAGFFGTTPDKLLR
jgi:transcriptional regulator with XRE-family HTH domain